ncbi:MAG: hypothetical protein QF921_05295 [Pseudomonadales bacterium]|jgi:hypothetical protein|nr:hypothetical protein [Pseudomonadales bacterium]MDP6471925.1 hypothetical protein [Pseudomonadales bacterium]MDP6826805.1 hypothetical protein [Pseudomonadales bacterium]MDP6970917.1 hypothetical protein [Pseudomonadales bacterium]|tara:strand:+ start:466 stop:702 length:237 start_codon:yes stop_codon:yes gene_type:complete
MNLSVRIVLHAALLLAATALTNACSARQQYELNRSLGEQSARCEEARTPEAEAACRAPYQRSYEAYQRELEALEEEAQ